MLLKNGLTAEHSKGATEAARLGSTAGPLTGRGDAGREPALPGGRGLFVGGGAPGPPERVRRPGGLALPARPLPRMRPGAGLPDAGPEAAVTGGPADKNPGDPPCTLPSHKRNLAITLKKNTKPQKSKRRRKEQRRTIKPIRKQSTKSQCWIFSLPSQHQACYPVHPAILVSFFKSSPHRFLSASKSLDFTSLAKSASKISEGFGLE
ncbi:uncharacterized protein [Manis javanica]|uniref:uncharacterized protein n=1 Tax=Manis javanica TaxID=9974 RepID=UPI003C6D9DF9